MLPAHTKEESSLGQASTSLIIARARHLPALVDDLLHDARNPLNALSINVEVMAERLRRDAGGVLSAAQEKSVKAIRDQVHRVDAILREFAEFLAPRAQPGSVDLSALVERALEVAGHQARKRRLLLSADVTADVKVSVNADRPVHDVVLLPLLRAIARSADGGTLRVSLRRANRYAVFRVEDQGAAGEEVEESAQAISTLCQEHDGRAELTGGVSEIFLPLA
ncbi:MAG: sensor histidine kinase [Myxococcota bacterium]